MRVANVGGRLTLVGPEVGSPGSFGPWSGRDVERASGGRFGSDPQAAFADWPALMHWASQLEAHADMVDGRVASVAVDASALGPPVPRPPQVIAIGANYGSTVRAAAAAAPSMPRLFTKFASCLAGPFTDVPVAGDQVDWEIELVVVIGRHAHDVGEAEAWDHVAGLMVGQDISERAVQMAGESPQYSLGKSFPCFGPTGPVLVTPDELPDPDDLALVCRVDGEVVQQARTSEMLLSVPVLVRQLSALITLLPGDIIFTGTPAGPGFTLDPQRYLQPGEVLDSEIGGIGGLRNVMVRQRPRVFR
jgi:2,4-didehydro-3-deoxy-L-rhamnonate hydrolase